MDKWLKKSQKNSASSEQDPSQSIPGGLPSPHNQRAPSPARSWDSNQEYSPSQTPIPSPQLHYSHNSPLPSPGYSYCPSPSPFPSTCPSPSPSPGHSFIPSPVLSICPSPHGSPRASRSPSPITREPPKSPCPSPPAPSRVRHYPEVQGQNRTKRSLAVSPHRPKIRSWLAPLPNTDNKNKPTNSAYPQTTHQQRPKTQTKQHQDRSQSKSHDSAVLNPKHTHSHKSKPKPNFNPSSKQLSEAPKAKHTPHSEQIQSSRSSHNSNPKSRPSFHSPTKAKHLAPTGREANPGHSSHTQSTSTAVTNSNTELNSRSNTSLKHKAKSWEATGPTPTKTTQRKPHSKQQEVERRGDHLNQAEGRKPERKEDRHREKQQGKQERKEDRRLAEEQLLRRPWIQSSAEEDGEEEEAEEEGVTERQRKREEKARGENSRRRKQQHRREWQTAQAKQPRCLQDKPHRQARTEKGGRGEEERDPSPPRLQSPAPQRPSSSSSASSDSESEPEYRAPITKVPADSTSQKKLPKRRQQGPDTADRPKVVVHSKAPASGNPSEGQQSGGRQKLYTLVPFGRGDHTTASSQRGLRNLVVQIDLCLLKRVPESTTSPTATKQSSSSFSSSTKDKQREMKHLYTPDTGTKDGKRKRKVGDMHIYLCGVCLYKVPCIKLGQTTVIYLCVYVCVCV